MPKRKAEEMEAPPAKKPVNIRWTKKHHAELMQNIWTAFQEDAVKFGPESEISMEFENGPFHFNINNICAITEWKSMKVSCRYIHSPTFTGYRIHFTPTEPTPISIHVMHLIRYLCTLPSLGKMEAAVMEARNLWHAIRLDPHFCKGSMQPFGQKVHLNRVQVDIDIARRTLQFSGNITPQGFMLYKTMQYAFHLQQHDDKSLNFYQKIDWFDSYQPQLSKKVLQETFELFVKCLVTPSIAEELPLQPFRKMTIAIHENDKKYVVKEYTIEKWKYLCELLKDKTKRSAFFEKYDSLFMNQLRSNILIKTLNW